MGQRHVRIEIPLDLLDRIDARAAEQAVSRSDLVLQVLDSFVSPMSSEEIDRQIIEGYRRFPPDEDDPWLDRAAGEIIRAEPWNDVRFGGSTNPDTRPDPSSS